MRSHMYDDGGLSGGTMERQALQRLLADIKAGKVQIIVVYKVDSFIPAFDKPSIGLEQHRWPQISLPVPPVARAAAGAAEAEDALIVAVEFRPVLRRLKAFLLRLGCLGLEPWIRAPWVSSPSPLWPHSLSPSYS